MNPLSRFSLSIFGNTVLEKSVSYLFDTVDNLGFNKTKSAFIICFSGKGLTFNSVCLHFYHYYPMPILCYIISNLTYHRGSICLCILDVNILLSSPV